MSLKEQIMADIKSAMKAKEQEKLTTLRFLNSAIKNKEIDVRPKQITEEEVLGVLKKMVKQRKDSIEQYESAGRKDLADKEKNELEYIQGYLPEQMGEDQVAAIVDDIIAASGASSMKDMGNVMKQVLAKTNGAADGALVSKIVKQKLN